MYRKGKCIFVSAVNIRFDYIRCRTNRGGNGAKSVALCGEAARVFLFYRAENLTGLTEAVSKKRKKNTREENGIKTDKTVICITTRRPEHREVETGSRHTLSISHLLSPSRLLWRESQFSLQPTGYGSIAEGETR